MSDEGNLRTCSQKVKNDVKSAPCKQQQRPHTQQATTGSVHVRDRSRHYNIQDAEIDPNVHGHPNAPSSLVACHIIVIHRPRYDTGAVGDTVVIWKIGNANA